MLLTKCSLVSLKYYKPNPPPVDQDDLELASHPRCLCLPYHVESSLSEPTSWVEWLVHHGIFASHYSDKTIIIMTKNTHFSTYQCFYNGNLECSGGGRIIACFLLAFWCPLLRLNIICAKLHSLRLLGHAICLDQTCKPRLSICLRRLAERR